MESAALGVSTELVVPSKIEALLEGTIRCIVESFIIGLDPFEDGTLVIAGSS